MTLSKTFSGRHDLTGKPKFKVGDTVLFNYILTSVRGKIVEDRGNIGIGGRRLYRVVGKTGSVVRVLELPDEELQQFDASAKSE